MEAAPVVEDAKMEDGAAETTAPPAVTTTAPPVTEAAPEGQKVALFEAEAPTGKRVRKKTAEVYKIATPVKKEKKEIVKGDGVELGTIDNIEYQIQKFQAMSDELILAHSFLYGVQGVKLERKKSIRAFSGFPKEADTEKKVGWLNGKSVAQLKMLGQIFDIGVSGQKVEMVETLMEFGATPAASGSKNIKEAKAQKREKNARKAAKKEKTNAGAKKGSAGGKKKKSTGLPPGAEHVKPAKTARYFYAQSVAKAVKAANPDADKADLMATIKEQFKALATKDAKKWEGQAKKDDARYAAEIAALEEDEDDFDVDDFDSDAEEEERPKKKAKKSAPKKKKAAPADDDDSDDDEPLKVGFPSNQKIRKCVDAIVRAADHEVMTKKTVRREAAAELKVDLDGKKDFIAQVIQETMNAMDEE